MTCGGENGTNGSHFPVFSEDIALIIASHFLATRPPPCTLPLYRGVGYAGKKLSKMVGRLASYTVYSIGVLAMPVKNYLKLWEGQLRSYTVYSGYNELL